MFKNLVIAVFIGTLLGIGGVLVAEIFDQRVRTTESLGSATGLPILVQFSKNSKPLGVKEWLKKMAGAIRQMPGSLRQKLRSRKPVTAI